MWATERMTMTTTDASEGNVQLHSALRRTVRRLFASAKRPDRLRGPPLQWVKRPGHEVDHTSNLVERLRMSGITPLLPLMSS